MIRTLRLSLVLALFAVIGLQASNNGKTGRTATTSAGCGSCHSSSASAAVTLSVPGSTGNSMNVTAGAKVNLSVLIAHTATGRTAGVDIAVKTDMTGTTDAGTLTAAGTNLKLSGTELTHSSPKTLTNNSATFDFAWTAPTTPGTYYLRAIGLSTNNNGVEDTGDLWARLPQFTLVVTASTPTPVITVLAPNGGEQWQSGSAHTITWTSTNVTTVAIDWSATGTNGPWTTIAASVAAASGSYAWTVPNTATTSGFVRVRDVSTTAATTSDMSNAAFTITTTPPPPPSPTLTLTAPVGGATLRIGTVVPITWRSTSVQNIMLDYSTTGVTGPWKNIVTSMAASAGTYQWTVPTDSSMSVFVRVSSVETPTLTSTNTINMMILPQSTAATFVLTVPQGGELYHVGDRVSIRWSGSAVKLLMSEEEDEDDDSSDSGDDDGDDDSDDDGDNGGDDNSGDTTGAGSGGSTDTTTTGGGGGSTDTTTTSGGGGGGKDTSTVSTVSLRIEWSADGPAGPWSVIAEGVNAKNAQFAWVVPNHPTTTAFVRLSNMLNSSQESINKIAFTILGTTADDGDTAEIETVHITAPRTGARLTPRTATIITWETRATCKVNVEWDACGDGWQTITSNIHANIGHYQWNVPKHADGLGVIRIVDAANPAKILEVSGAFMVVNPVLTDVSTQDENGRALIAPQPVSNGHSFTVRKPQEDVVGCDVISITGQTMHHADLPSMQTQLSTSLAPGAYVIRWMTTTGALPFTTSLMIVP
ncbi:MAG: hypothetical protein JSS89_05640 [Bacteroidetes bacterium]|nr:hypothetical protein [Bacteroidota bacterium]